MTALRRAQVQLGATLLFALALIGVLGLVAGSSRAVAACGRLVVASSAEKFGLLSTLAAGYNAAQPAGAACVRVVVEEVNSGDAERALETGWSGLAAERPDVWSPASSAWVQLLAARSQRGATEVLPPLGDLLQSPTVIGMPQPMAAALGYPGAQLGWTDLSRLIADPAGWGAVQHPEWGRFRLGKTNPTVSTSGLHALVASYFAAVGGVPLTSADVSQPRVHDFAAGIESGVIHYGETAGDFLLALRDADNRGAATSYISAVAVEEKELADYNRGVIAGTHHGAPHTPLVPIYPKEGTLVADHPYVPLRWSLQQAAATGFFDYLTLPAQQATIQAEGFRNRFGAPGAALARLVPRPDPLAREVVVPSGDALVAMLDAWQELRRAARVLILVDTTASPNVLRPALASLSDAVRNFQPRDLAGVWTFPAPPGSSRPYGELAPLLPSSPAVARALSAIRPAPGAVDPDAALRAAVDALAATYDPARVDAVLLVELSPEETRAGADLPFESWLRNQPANRLVRIFTVGPAGSGRLHDLSLAGQGFSYQPGTTSHLLNDVISNF
ncbi:MAG: substrate-binding domain-containing protein [Candidatus Dormibacteria bacterium]